MSLVEQLLSQRAVAGTVEYCSVQYSVCQLTTLTLFMHEHSECRFNGPMAVPSLQPQFEFDMLLGDSEGNG